MKVTQNAENGIFESSDFQNFPGEHAPGPYSSLLHRNAFPLSFIEVRLQLSDKTVSRKKKEEE